MNGLRSQLTALDNEIGYYLLMNEINVDDLYTNLGDRVAKAKTRKARASLLKQFNEYAISIGMKAREVVSSKSVKKQEINVKKWVLIFRLGVILIWVLGVIFLFYQGATCLCEEEDYGYSWMIGAIMLLIPGGVLAFMTYFLGGDSLEEKLKRVNVKRRLYA